MQALTEYPSKIATKARDLRRDQDGLLILRDALSTLQAEIEMAIAIDAELKNDTQRKAKRLELQRQSHYVQMLSEVRETEFKCDMAAIVLQRLRDEFSVMKLMLRRECAELEAAA
jgi:hypothetical protein